MNEHRTFPNSDTLLTRLRSLAVPALPRGPLVYFVRKGDEVKIGFTHRLSQRMNGLGGGELVLLGTVPGTTTTERMYHERFAHLRAHGEWFRAEQELLDAIEEEASTPTPWTPNYRDLAAAFMRKARKDLTSGNSGLIIAQTNHAYPVDTHRYPC